MKLWKKLTALATALAMAFALTGCLGNGYSRVLTVDGVDFTPGLYLMLQLRAYSEAEGLVENEEKDVLKQKVEGQNAKSWIRARTEEMARRYVAVKNLAIEHGVTLSEESWEGLESTSEYWYYLEDYYYENGIGYDNWMFQLENSYLDSELFSYLYGEDGPFFPGKQAMMEAYSEVRTHIRYLSLPTTYSASAETEQEYDDDTLTQMVQDAADAMLAKLENGTTTFEELADNELREIYDWLARTYAVEEPEEYVFDMYINPESDTYEEDFRATLETAKIGDYGYYWSGTAIVLYEIIPMFEGDDDFEAQFDTILSLLYSDDYDAYLKTVYSDYDVSKAFLAVWYYSPGKIS